MEGTGAVPRSRRSRSAERFTFSFASDRGSIAPAVDRLEAAAVGAGVTHERTRLRLRIATGEAVTNAALHGNGGDPARRVEVELEVGPDRVRVTVADEGDGFDPAAVPDPTLDGRRERDGGRGLFLMRTHADAVRHSERGARVTLVVER